MKLEVIKGHISRKKYFFLRNIFLQNLSLSKLYMNAKIMKAQSKRIVLNTIVNRNETGYSMFKNKLFLG